jgi:hypothetical protein
MMKHQYIKRVFGGRGMEAPIIIGHIGVVGGQVVVMVGMDIMEDDGGLIAAVVAPGVLVVEERIVADLVEVGAVDLVEVVVEDLVEAVVEVEEVVVEVEEVADAKYLLHTLRFFQKHSFCRLFSKKSIE